MKRSIAALAAVSAIGAMAPVLLAAPASAAPITVKGEPTVNPVTGGPTTPFVMGVSNPGGGAGTCPGDGAAGWAWSTFIIPASASIDTLSFQGSGAPVQVAGEFRQNLFAAAGGAVRLKGPDAGANTITGIPSMSFNPIAAAIPAGTYQYGIACHGGPAGTAVVDSAWSRTVTIAKAGTTFTSYTLGAPLAAPAISTVTPSGTTSLNVVFSPATGGTAPYTYSATATPTVGSAVTVSAQAGSPIAIPGLTPNTTYSVTVSAIDSATTPATVTSSPMSGTTNDVVLDRSPDPVTATPGAESASVNWTKPADSNPTQYVVSLASSTSGAVIPANQTVNAPALTANFTGLTGGATYTATVTPAYSDATPVVAAASAPFTVNLSNVVVQNISGTRPSTGALVLTQDCGVNNPTCTVDLGTGTPVQGGVYFQATGNLLPVTVTDTRDGDRGWSVKGTLSTNFTKVASTETFSGTALGWVPSVSGHTNTALPGYAGMNVTAGGAVLPWSTTGIAGSTLMSAPAGSGLGSATATAGLTLQIPVTASAGTYNAVLTMTAS